jgi:hypothetical protein
MRGERLQSRRESLANSNVSKAYMELAAAERRLAELRGKQ